MSANMHQGRINIQVQTIKKTAHTSQNIEIKTKQACLWKTAPPTSTLHLIITFKKNGWFPHQIHIHPQTSSNNFNQ
ncbi:hypothetical protein Hanom_Chr14g01280761 [Helianthus anomalus]